MTCKTIDLGNGALAIACSRGRRRRAPCGTCGTREHDLLCDHPLTGKMAKKTCSAKLCRGCAVHVDDVDLCPPHAKVRAAQADLDLARAATAR